NATPWSSYTLSSTVFGAGTSISSPSESSRLATIPAAPPAPVSPTAPSVPTTTVPASAPPPPSTLLEGVSLDTPQPETASIVKAPTAKELECQGIFEVPTFYTSEARANKALQQTKQGGRSRSAGKCGAEGQLRCPPRRHRGTLVRHLGAP